MGVHAHNIDYFAEIFEVRFLKAEIWTCSMGCELPTDTLLRRFLWPRNVGDLSLCDRFAKFKCHLIAMRRQALDLGMKQRYNQEKLQVQFAGTSLVFLFVNGV